MALSILILLGYCGFANLHIPLAGMIWFAIKRRVSMPFSVEMALLVLVTFLLELVYPQIFPWNLGYPWIYTGTQVHQVAEFVGFEGLSLLTLIFNGYLCGSYGMWRRGALRNPVWPLLSAMIVLGFLVTVGQVRLEQLQKEEYKSVRILQVQANIGNHQKIMAEKGDEFDDYIRGRYIHLTTQALNEDLGNRVDLLVWPEVAIPEYLDSRFHFRHGPKELKYFLKSTGIPSVIGGFSRTPKGVFNSLFAFDGQGELIGDPYRKTILLAFGEYFPGANYFPFLKKIVPAISDFSRGSGPTVKRVGGLEVGFQICYESLHPEFVKSLVEHGAQIFVNATNDSWFGTFSEPWQHFYMTAARAIEFRRPVIRTTNTGLTSAVMADGTHLRISPLFEEWTAIQEVFYLENPPRTLYSMICGWYFWIIMIILIGIIGFYGFKKSRLESNR